MRPPIPRCASISLTCPRPSCCGSTRAALKRAIGNLIANSIDAMDGRGDVEIAADLVKAADSRYCRLRIRDTGRGIPGSLGEKVFMPYFTTKSSGTGLGLSIVERIVEEHGGAIRFESEEGAGTTFYRRPSPRSMSPAHQGESRDGDHSRDRRRTRHQVHGAGHPRGRGPLGHRRRGRRRRPRGDGRPAARPGRARRVAAPHGRASTRSRR